LSGSPIAVPVIFRSSPFATVAPLEVAVRNPVFSWIAAVAYLASERLSFPWGFETA
jgi:hypothetical protein